MGKGSRNPRRDDPAIDYGDHGSERWDIDNTVSKSRELYTYSLTNQYCEHGRSRSGKKYNIINQELDIYHTLNGKQGRDQDHNANKNHVGNGIKNEPDE